MSEYRVFLSSLQDQHQPVNRRLLICLLVILALAKGTHPWPLSASHPFPENGTNRVFNDAGKGIPTCLSVCEYSHSKAHCHDRNLSHIPNSDGCEEAILLELQRNEITSITSEQISGYQQLSTLDISRNDLSNITSGTFHGNPNLQNVDISYNFLTVLYGKTFEGAEQSLSHIEIQYNSINLITEYAFEGLEHVTRIYLSHNQLHNLLPGIFKDLLSLQYLDLSWNKLVTLPQNILHNSTSLRTLNLKENKLQHIPIRLFYKLESIQYVDLSNNQLVSIPTPQELCLFHQLLMLDLQNNKISQSDVMVPFLSSNVTDNLRVTGNPFFCDCNFQKLQILSQVQVGSQAQPIQCMYRDGSNFTISHTLPFDCNGTTQTQPTPSSYDNDKLLPGNTHGGSHVDDIISANPPEDPKCTIYVIVICALSAGLIICLICFVLSIKNKFYIACWQKGTKKCRKQRQGLKGDLNDSNL